MRTRRMEPARPDLPISHRPVSSRWARLRGLFDRRVADRPPWLVVTEIFFGLGWARAAAEKAVSIDWWTGDTIRLFVADHAEATLPWMQPLVEALVLPAVGPWVFGVVLAQLAFAAALLSGRFVGRAVIGAMTLNLVFVAIGAVNPSAFYLVGQGAVGLWMLGRLRAGSALSAWLRWLAAGGAALAAVSLPFLATIHPAAAIDDPAIMLGLFGGLAALAAELTHRASFGRSLP